MNDRISIFRKYRDFLEKSLDFRCVKDETTSGYFEFGEYVCYIKVLNDRYSQNSFTLYRYEDSTHTYIRQVKYLTDLEELIGSVDEDAIERLLVFIESEKLALNRNVKRQVSW